MDTVTLMNQAFHIRTDPIEDEVPPLDLRIKLSRVPAIPARKVVITRLRGRNEQSMDESLIHNALVNSESINGKR